MTELSAFWGDVLIGTLYAIAFAAVLTGYLWDFFRFSKRTTVILLLVYCVLASLADQLTVARYGFGAEHQISYLLTICIVPYIGIYCLTRMPFVKYLYCLASVSIQVFFIVGMMEYFRISNDEVMQLSVGAGACCALGLFALDTVILFVFRRFAAPLFQDYLNLDTWRKLLALPLSGSVALGSFYFLTNFTTSGISVLFVFTACYVAFFIADVAAMNGVRISIRAVTAEKRLESADLILSAQKEQYQRLSDSIAETRQARHDLRHHMNAVNGFLAADDKEGLRAYVKEYAASLPNNEDALYTGNYAADIIVGHYLSLARQRGIRVDYSLRIPEDCCVRDTDLCVLMGNCLENAVYACGKIPPEQRFLRVESAVRNKYLAITVANSYNGDAMERDGVYLSDKRERSTAGVGLESVRAVVRAYNGEMKLEGKNGVFTVYLLLKMLARDAAGETRETVKNSES